MTKAEIIKQRLPRVIVANIPFEGLKSLGNGGYLPSVPTREWVGDIITEIFERKCNTGYRDSFSVAWEAGWASEVSVDIDLDRLRVALSWSSTYRTVSQAVGTIALYSAAATFAAKVQAVMDEIRDSRDFEEAKE